MKTFLIQSLTTSSSKQRDHLLTHWTQFTNWLKLNIDLPHLQSSLGTKWRMKTSKEHTLRNRSTLKLGTYCKLMILKERRLRRFILDKNTMIHSTIMISLNRSSSHRDQLIHSCLHMLLEMIRGNWLKLVPLKALVQNSYPRELYLMDFSMVSTAKISAELKLALKL